MMKQFGGVDKAIARKTALRGVRHRSAKKKKKTLPNKNFSAEKVAPLPRGCKSCAAAGAQKRRGELANTAQQAAVRQRSRRRLHQL